MHFSSPGKLPMLLPCCIRKESHFPTYTAAPSILLQDASTGPTVSDNRKYAVTVSRAVLPRKIICTQDQ